MVNININVYFNIPLRPMGLEFRDFKTEISD